MKNIIFTLMLVVSFVSCTKQSVTSNNDTFVYCSEGSPSAFNPQVTTDGTSANAAAGTIYNNIVQFIPGTTKVGPGLADKWEISEDGLTYTFKLRKDVEFHKTSFFTPTRKLTADDVLWSFNRMRLAEHPFHKVNGGIYEYFSGMEMGKIIKSLEKTDDYTIVFKLSKPEAPFLANLAMPFASILSKEYGEQLSSQDKKEEIDYKPVGTGPFVFKSYVKDNIIRYTSHPKYFKGEPSIKKLVFTITPDPSVRSQKLKAGECHLVIEPAPADLIPLKNEKHINIVSQQGLNVGYMAMNTQKAPFDNLLVRKAISHALNRESYINAIYLNNAVVAKNPMPPTMWGYHKGTKQIEYNPEKAKELLKQAGHPNGFETELWTLPVSRPYNPNGKKMGEMIQADLAKIGVKVKLISYDWPTYLSKARTGEHQLIQLGWSGDNGDPDNFLHTLLGCSAVESGSNVARWCHEEFDKTVKLAKRKTTLEERTTLYEKAQEIFKEQVPWVTIAHSIVYRAMNTSVKNYVIDPMSHDYFHNVKLEANE